jgi:hypothetical protein
MRNDKFIDDYCKGRGPHALLGDVIARLDGVEAIMLLHAAANHAGSNVPQAILRDGLNRVRIAAEEKVPT